MPIYDFYCPACNVKEEFIVSPSEVMTHKCGTQMRKCFSIPKIIMKPSGNEMALNSLNSKDTAHMRPEMKRKAARGLNKPPKPLF